MTRKPSFKLGTFSLAGCRPFAGLVLDDRVMALEAVVPMCRELGFDLSGSAAMLGLLERWPENLAALGAVAEAAAGDPAFGRRFEGVGVSVDTLRLHPPVMPRQVFCSGANYRNHVIDMIVDTRESCPEELKDDPEALRAWATQLMDDRAAKGSPYMFTKPVSAVTGPFDSVLLPARVARPDWELELAVVMGRAARDVSRAEAMNHVAGFTIANDISARDHIWRRDELSPMGTDWVAGKCAPSFLPLGPYLVPAPFVGDLADLRLMLKVNGEVMQNETTADMIFDVPRQIEYLSGLVQLLPGDIICTGSPAGNAMHHGNRFLRDGDLMEGTITGLGTQRNPCIGERS